MHLYAYIHSHHHSYPHAHSSAHTYRRYTQHGYTSYTRAFGHVHPHFYDNAHFHADNHRYAAYRNLYPDAYSHPTSTHTYTPTFTPTFFPCSQPINEGFEGGGLGLFVSSGAPGWSAVTADPHTGLYSAFAPDVANTSDQRLTLISPIYIPTLTSQANLHFWHRYDLEAAPPLAFDGAVLEASSDGGGSWSELPVAIGGGYNYRVASSCSSSNPLAGRMVWSGNSGGWQQVVVDLTTYRGQSVLFRFRLGTDETGSAAGWWIDDVEITFTQSFCSSPTATGTRPTATITLTATYTPTPTITSTPTITATTIITSTPCSITFTDVTPADYFYKAVLYLYCRGSISGYSDNTFRPFNNVTRAQLCKIVVLAAGWELVCPETPHFTDVPRDHPFYCYIETTYLHAGIVGYADGTFRPYNDVTRAQLAKILVLTMMGWTLECPTTPHFSDVQQDNAFYCYIETAYAHGVVSGYGDDTFRPYNSATRGQICLMVYRAVSQP